MFKKYQGAYFWSLLITSLAIIIYSFGAWGKLVSISKYPLFPVSFTTWGWVAMVVGQSIVLWSRLHLITQNDILLKGILWGIIINSFLMCTPTVVLTYGSNTADWADYVRGYQVMERIQMTAFSVQELFISGVYLWEVRRLLKVVYEGRTRKLMWEIAAINVAIIILDVALLSVEFIDLYQIEITLKGMVYSIKLKLEFGVLSKLVKIITNRKESSMEISDEMKNTGTSIARLTPAHTRDTETTYRASIGTSLGVSSTLVNSNNGSGSKRSDSDLWPSERTRTGSGVGAAAGVTAVDMLQDDYGTYHVGTEEHELPPSRHRPSLDSRSSDFYPGRLV